MGFRVDYIDGAAAVNWIELRFRENGLQCLGKIIMLTEGAFTHAYTTWIDRDT